MPLLNSSRASERERERGGERQTDRQTDRDRQRQSQRQREKERERQTETTERQTDRRTKTETDRQTDRDRLREHQCIFAVFLSVLAVSVPRQNELSQRTASSRPSDSHSRDLSLRSLWPPSTPHRTALPYRLQPKAFNKRRPPRSSGHASSNRKSSAAICKER